MGRWKDLAYEEAKANREVWAIVLFVGLVCFFGPIVIALLS